MKANSLNETSKSSHTPTVFLVAMTGSCGLCHISSSRQSRPPDMRVGEILHSCRIAETDNLLRLWGPSSPASAESGLKAFLELDTHLSFGSSTHI